MAKSFKELTRLSGEVIPLADFDYNRVLYLRGTFDNINDDVQWNGTIVQTFTGTIVDGTGSGAGVLSLDDGYSETHTFGEGEYTGWYVTVALPAGGSANYGIFATGVSPWGLAIPYDDAVAPPSFAAAVGNSSGDATLGSSSSLAGAANCFISGARISTPQGTRAIEELAPGDLILSADGTARRVLWVWRQEITNIFGLGDGRAPVRLRAHALGPNCPAADLVVTADHGLLVDGLLINAGALVNGDTIAFVPLHQMPARFSYWHIETEAHDVILAEGCPAESFIDYAGRRSFDSYDAYIARYGEERVIREMPKPRISSARLLPPALRARLQNNGTTAARPMACECA